MHHYMAYGLGIHSELPFPELFPVETKADIIIRVDHLNHSLYGSVDGLFRVTADEVGICYTGVGSILIRDGSEIVVDPVPGVAETELRFSILGAPFGVLLHQRGRLVLHASAALLANRHVEGSQRHSQQASPVMLGEDGAVAFLGAPGAGKSTTAAALYARGHPVIADDLVPIAFDDGSNENVPIVYPGFPLLKLWPEAASALGDDISASPRVNATIDKRARRIDRGFATAPLALKRVYVLAGGEHPEIEPLTPQESFVELVRHTFVVNLLDATVTRSLHFRQCSMLATQVSVRRLKRPPSLGALSAVTELVEQDLLVHPASTYASGR